MIQTPKFYLKSNNFLLLEFYRDETKTKATDKTIGIIFTVRKVNTNKDYGMAKIPRNENEELKNEWESI